MRLLFVGESWLGSCARSLKEALNRHPDVCLDEVNEDLHVPKAWQKSLRAIHRVLERSYSQELNRQILQRVAEFAPDVFLVYKGARIEESLVRHVRAQGVMTVNVYPDLSPHAHGAQHRRAVGAYELIVSTKPFHPALWQSVYGYSNRCVFVPQGYDPFLHQVTEPVREPQVDLVLVATWRQEYGVLMEALGHLLAPEVSVAIAGQGWPARRQHLPSHWVVAGAQHGRTYVEWLRRGRICLGLVTRQMSVDGRIQPGDEDTTRTYELAAANCFFIHRRTPYVQQLYSESDEVPMFDTAEELAGLVTSFLSNPDERLRMAANAHRRAVPAYSIDMRARDVVAAVEKVVDSCSPAVSRR